jgi:hypothetical protein
MKISQKKLRKRKRYLKRMHRKGRWKNRKSVYQGLSKRIRADQKFNDFETKNVMRRTIYSKTRVENPIILFYC